MKNLKLLFVVFITAMQAAIAQSPFLINYQGVARDAGGNPIANQLIRVKLKIRDNMAAGPLLYNETNKVTTSASGLFNIQIGSANAINVTGSLQEINWSIGKKFLQVEMDPAGGTNFINMGAQQLVSVPFAIQASMADSLAPDATVNTSQLSPGGASTGQLLQFNGNNWEAAHVKNIIDLPYAETDSTFFPMFDINNKYADSSSYAIKGSGNAGSGIYGKSNYSNGICGNAKMPFKSGLFGYNDTIYGVGVSGRSNGVGGMGVRGDGAGNSSYGVYGSNTDGVGVGGQTASPYSYGVWGYNAAGTGIKGVTAVNTSLNAGVHGDALSQYGTGVQGTADEGRAVYGRAADGIGVCGESAFHIAGYFDSQDGTGIHAESTTGIAIHAESQTETAIYAESTNGVAGKFFAAPNNVAGEFHGKVTVTEDLTVNGSYGIIRNSASAQLRYLKTTVSFAMNIPANATINSAVFTFPTPFASPPAVMVGNITTFSGNAERLLLVPVNVTATNCTFKINNLGNFAFPFTGTWNIVIVGE